MKIKNIINLLRKIVLIQINNNSNKTNFLFYSQINKIKKFKIKYKIPILIRLVEKTINLKKNTHMMIIVKFMRIMKNHLLNNKMFKIRIDLNKNLEKNLKIRPR